MLPPTFPSPLSPSGCTVQCSTVQYSTVQYSTVQYSTVQYSTVQYSTVQYSTGRPLDLQTIVTGWRPPCITHVHYRVFDSGYSENIDFY